LESLLEDLQGKGKEKEQLRMKFDDGSEGGGQDLVCSAAAPLL
jgi:hypothetical protein